MMMPGTGVKVLLATPTAPAAHSARAVRHDRHDRHDRHQHPMHYLGRTGLHVAEAAANTLHCLLRPEEWRVVETHRLIAKELAETVSDLVRLTHPLFCARGTEEEKGVAGVGGRGRTPSASGQRRKRTVDRE